MLRRIKNSVLRGAGGIGILNLIAGSKWRQRRLLILCYHGIALKDEHLWSGGFYIPPRLFRERLEIIARSGYRVLPLSEAVAGLRAGSLPPRSVVITFDDGFHDFYVHAFPLLQEFGFPATVYQTTYYSDYPFPIFNLVLSYLFWRASGRKLDGSGFGVPDTFSLSAHPPENAAAVDAFLKMADERRYTPEQKNELAARLACVLGVDYEEMSRMRMLQLMDAEELRAIRARGIDIQLHTHRHRTPASEDLFNREIRDNRSWLKSSLGISAEHFCYPSGVWRPEFLPWLRAAGVLSAVTCEYGLAGQDTDPLLLPRLLDSMSVTEADFRGWLSGVSSLLPHRRSSGN